MENRIVPLLSTERDLRAKGIDDFQQSGRFDKQSGLGNGKQQDQSTESSGFKSKFKPIPQSILKPRSPEKKPKISNDDESNRIEFPEDIQENGDFDIRRRDDAELSISPEKTSKEGKRKGGRLGNFIKERMSDIRNEDSSVFAERLFK